MYLTVLLSTQHLTVLLSCSESVLLSCSNSPSWPSRSRCLVSVVTHMLHSYQVHIWPAHIVAISSLLCGGAMGAMGNNSTLFCGGAMGNIFTLLCGGAAGTTGNIAATSTLSIKVPQAVSCGT